MLPSHGLCATLLLTYIQWENIGHVSQNREIIGDIQTSADALKFLHYDSDIILSSFRFPSQSPQEQCSPSSLNGSGTGKYCIVCLFDLQP